MRHLYLIPIFLFLSCLTTRNVNRQIYIKTIGWKFQLNNDTQFLDSSFDSKGKILEEIPSEGASLRLLAIKDSSHGAFSVYLRKDTSNLQDWKNWHDKDTKWYFEKKRQLPDFTTLEEKYYSTTIDTISFLVQYSKYIKKGGSDTTYSYHHFGRVKDIELDISFWFKKQLIGKKYLEIIQKSKFDN